MKNIFPIKLDFKSLLLYAFVVLTVLFDNTENTFYATFSFALLLLFTISEMNKSAFNGLNLNILFPIWCFLSLIWSTNPTGGFTRATTCAILTAVLVVFVIYSNKRDSSFVDSVLFVYVIGSLILSVMTYQTMQNIGLLQMLAAVERLETDILNLNMLGKYFAIAAVICIHFIVSKGKLVYYIPLAIFVFFVLLTKSRSSLLSLAIGAFFYLYYYYKGIGNLKRYWIIIAAIFAVLFMLSKLTVWGDAFIRFEGMFDFFTTNGNSGDYSTEMRDLYLRKGLESIPESPIWGHGLGSVVDVMRRLVDSTMTVEDAYFHNNYVQIWSELGIIGFLLFYIPLYRIIKSLLKYTNDKNAVILLSIIIMFLFCDTNNTTYYHKIYYIFIGLCFFYINAKRKENSINKQIQV